LTISFFDTIFIFDKNGSARKHTSGNFLLSVLVEQETIMVLTKHLHTIAAVFERPTKSNIRWTDIENMITAYGGLIEERAGSRVLIRLNGRRAVFHRPHPRPDTDKGALVALRRFLIEANLRP
jgi:hypothetical protein